MTNAYDKSTGDLDFLVQQMNLFNQIGAKELDLGEVRISVYDQYPLVTGIKILLGSFHKNMIGAYYAGPATFHTLGENYMEIESRNNDSAFSVRLPVKKWKVVEDYYKNKSICGYSNRFGLGHPIIEIVEKKIMID